MPIIGIMGKENECNYIRHKIKKNSKINKFEIININEKSIENVKNIKFDCLVVCENSENFLKKSSYLEKIIKNVNYLIINLDKNRNCFYNNTNVITYGLNIKSMITISSIKEDDVMFCIQNKIKTVYKLIIEEQEFSINIKKNNSTKLYSYMVIFIILLIYGEELQKNEKN